MLIAVSLSPLASLAAVAVAAATTVLSRPSPGRLPALTLVAAAVSLAVTSAHVIAGVRPEPVAALLELAENLALMALVGLVVRYAPVRRAVPAALTAGVATAVWSLRFLTPVSLLEAVGACAFWGVGSLLAAGAGGYLRFLDVRQARAVVDARTVLRLRLARDLHDFVAHDISEMVAHAQAGGVTGDPLRALERVEAAGQRAMSMLDRTLDMLHNDRPVTFTGGLGDIREAADRFSAAGPATVHLRLDQRAEVPVEVAALAYRIVVEGLTNVRRHAPQAGRVDLDVVAGPSGTLEVMMTNDGVTRTRSGRRSGLGLPGLAGLVREQGGELRTRSVPGGWSLTASLPFPGPGLPSTTPLPSGNGGAAGTIT
ncbi:sensor histidine kinase [Streptosporangium sp. NPDC049376]|uniref:sensor histidine kinase n=1 Tax=Streptosporangium sp. NPDC049376 TaxID=3366192 RepID=UPI00378FC3FB